MADLVDYSYAQQAHLERALGGAHILVQLADPQKNGQPDQAIVSEYLEDGAAEVRSAVEVKHDPEVIANLDAPSLRRLVSANAALSARIAWERGGKGMAMPEHIETAAVRAETFLGLLSEGKRRLGRIAGGTTAAVTQAGGIGVIDYDSRSTSALDPNKASSVSVAGFKRGFR